MGLFDSIAKIAVVGVETLIEKSNQYTEEYEHLSDLELQVEYTKLEKQGGNLVRKNAIHGLLIGRGYDKQAWGWVKKDIDTTSPPGML
ncbi:hypothetical protein [Sporomusa acidovorans]|uniref:Uncharacterized protein n=1 Tax=Sporomusa acidovorans (strain ATCC 49682 / DSM 3132 / Mol) TaxID=1123286 RepID=A0ABZ3IZU0_SPOA4|nr:hypothetical protein [Sporomusa acidovorans]OZC19197.1 hypothetical protein SPACI_32830 [Sporomusa acidovorans DSM 3132]SDF11183.1 hypothetical protein SAMN04488499_103321 [Sporomusa acidovorans]